MTAKTMDCPFKTDPSWDVRYEYREESPNFPATDQFHVTFPNGWGASVIRGGCSYGRESGLWELAVIKDGRLNYSHHVAENDVRGWLTEEAVSALLAEIAATPKDGAS